MFQDYIAISSSLWYDDHLLLRIEDNLSTYQSEKIKAYFSVGNQKVNQNWNMPDDLNRFTEKLRNMQLDHLKMKQDLGDNETHNSIFPSSLSIGLRFVFESV